MLIQPSVTCWLGLEHCYRKMGCFLSEKEVLEECRHLQNQSQPGHLCLPQLLQAAVPGERSTACRLLFCFRIKVTALISELFHLRKGIH